MNTIRSISFLTALAAAALLTGCGSSGLPDILGNGNPRGPYDRGTYDQNVNDVQGTVARVDTSYRRILVDRNDDRNLRNGNDQIALYYDDRTTVEYQGKTFRPEDLEAGDRIQADVAQSSDRLIAQDIQVVYDVSSANGGYNNGGYNNGGYNNGGYNNGGYNSGNGSYNRDLRGTVRTVDTRNHTLELDTSGYDSGYRSNFSTGTNGTYGSNGSYNTGNVVVVRYDSGTTVEYQGRRYGPENLERGDVVNVQVRDLGGQQWLAESIEVVGQGQPVR
jgi:hypothetical protein